MATFKEARSMHKLKLLKAEQEERLVKTMAAKHGVGYVDLAAVPINTDALKLIPEERAKLARMAAFSMANRDIAIAVTSPHVALVAEEIERLRSKKWNPTVYMTSKRSLDRAWSRYGDISYAVKTEEGVIDISSADVEDIVQSIQTFEDAKKLLDQALSSKQAYRVSKVIEVMLYAAYALGASDIHIEPEDDKTNLRYRIDGILNHVTTFDMATYQRILSRVKLTAGMKLNIRDNAQDGRFSIKLADNELEIRTSALPEAYGESIVMRILDPRSIAVEIESLGMLPYMQERMMHEISRPNGMILNTGPTGSGKSTTLFSFLRRINNDNNKVITVENPIEYHVPGIVQTQIEEEDGYDFPTAVRAAMRQDPEVMMVGEIRDEETAKAASDFSLTGHLVLSTLHTNSAAGTFARLHSLDVSTDTLATAVNVVMAQRLVRKLCEHCKKEVPFETVDEYMRGRITKVLNDMPRKREFITQTETVYVAEGCSECNGMGYRGRVGVFEAIFRDEKLEQTLKETVSESDVVKATRHQGVLRLKEDAMVKVFNGTTSLDEVLRVIDLD